MAYQWYTEEAGSPIPYTQFHSQYSPLYPTSTRLTDAYRRYMMTGVIPTPPEAGVGSGLAGETPAGYIEGQVSPHLEAGVPAAAPGAPGAPAVAPVTDVADMSPYFEAGEMLTAPMSEYEQQALDMLQQLATSLGGMPSPWETPMGQDVGTALTSLLSGEFPEEYFRTSIEAPAQKRLEEVTLPGVREAYVGPGTFWGGERAEAERRAGTDVDMMLAAVRGDLGYKARQPAPTG